MDDYFIGRDFELDALNRLFKSKKAEFVVIYGRRRIGKSKLIEKFIENKKGINLLAREESDHLQLRNFSHKLSEFFNDKFLAKNPFSDWDAFFTYLNEKTKNERIVIAIDEFPYIANENKSTPSIIQDYWDNKFIKGKIFLILNGSSISMMEKKILGHKSPLYGRRTAQLLLKPLEFKNIFNEIKNFDKSLQEYSTFGGTPAYFKEFNPNKSLNENIKTMISYDSFFFKDAEFILREELKEPRYYFSILESIAKGKTSLAEIVNDTGIQKGVVAKYLSVLNDLHLIKREVPVTENVLKSRKGIYIISDNFFKFWLKYIYPFKELIETNQQEQVLKQINQTLNQHISFIFEDVGRQAIQELNKQEKLPFDAIKIGRYWYKDNEIDIIALNQNTKEILFAECKYKENVEQEKILKKLKTKAKQVKWFNEERKEYYVIIAKSFKNKTKNQNTTLIDKKKLEEIFKK